jgi:polygalacturonase
MIKLLGTLLLMTVSWAAHADDCEFIRKAINDLPASGGMVQIPGGTFDCSKMIVVKKSHVTR